MVFLKQCSNCLIKLLKKLKSMPEECGVEDSVWNNVVLGLFGGGICRGSSVNTFSVCTMSSFLPLAKLACLLFSLKGSPPLPLGGRTDPTGVFQIRAGGTRRGPQLEETDLQGHCSAGRLRPRVLQDPDLPWTAGVAAASAVTAAILAFPCVTAVQNARAALPQFSATAVLSFLTGMRRVLFLINVTSLLSHERPTSRALLDK